MSLLLLATSFPWALFHLLSTSQSTTAIARRGRNSLAIAHPSRGRSPRRHDAACLHSTRRRMSLASSSSSKGLENDDGDSTTTATMTVVAPKAPPPSSPPPSTSSRARSTLDPCVILMKRMISKHAHKWEAEGGIHSLAQGVVHWRPPDSAYEALNDAVRENVEMTTTDNDRSDGGAGGGGGRRRDRPHLLSRRGVPPPPGGARGEAPGRERAARSARHRHLRGQSGVRQLRPSATGRGRRCREQVQVRRLLAVLLQSRHGRAVSSG